MVECEEEIEELICEINALLASPCEEYPIPEELPARRGLDINDPEVCALIAMLDKAIAGDDDDEDCEQIEECIVIYGKENPTH